ncbi:MAG: hypothetical protein HYY91_02250 [Candidatus Omnitrophica bacterium]|nr:hypothetical protein [Candidatus Omnitrophota bacterium]
MFLWFVCGLWLTSFASAGSIDTAFLERDWPKQYVHEYEVGKYPVRWRQKAGKTEGIFAGALFLAPSGLQRTWELATDYTDLGTKTPGVTAVRFLENTETRQVIEIDAKVLWKTLTLRFEVERDPPRAIRFRLLNEAVGEYRGMCLMREEDGQTRVGLATWLQPAVRVPPRLILWAERVVILKGVRNFLKTCEGPR